MINRYSIFIACATILFVALLLNMVGDIFWNFPPDYEKLMSVEGRIFFLDVLPKKGGVPLMIYGKDGQIKLYCWDVERSDTTCFKKDERNGLRGKIAVAKYYVATRFGFVPENRLMELVVNGDTLIKFEEKFNLYSIRKIRIGDVIGLLGVLSMLAGGLVLLITNNINTKNSRHATKRQNKK